MPERGDLLLAEGGAGGDRAMESAIQHGTATFVAGLSASGTASNLAEATGAWRYGKRCAFPTSPHPPTTTDKFPTRRYTNIPLGTKNRSGHSLSRYSPGTSSSGTSCVRTSFSSASSALSTPVTTSASNALPSSINSSTLSESADSMLDNPCESPDCPADRDLSPWSSNGSTSKLRLLVGTRFLMAPAVFAPAVFLPTVFVFPPAFFKAGFFFANFFFGAGFFLANFFVAAFLAGLPLFGPVFLSFLCFFLAFLLAIGAVYHGLMDRPILNSDLSAESARD